MPPGKHRERDLPAVVYRCHRPARPRDPVPRFRVSNYIDIVNLILRSALLRASRRTATGEIVPASVLRDAVLRTAPQDEVRGLRLLLPAPDRILALPHRRAKPG